MIRSTLRLDEEREKSFLDSRRDLRNPITRPRRTLGKLAGAHVSSARLAAEEESVEAIDLESEVDLALGHKRKRAVDQFLGSREIFAQKRAAAGRCQTLVARDNQPRV